jgi:NCS1 family nucleobase:cation symporter-1
MANKEYPVTEAVPAEDRHFGFVDMALTWMGANCQCGSWAVGGALAGLGFMGAFGVIVIGNPIAYAILALVGLISYKVGTSTMGLTRVSFGIRGTKMPTVCNNFNTLGWAAMNNFFASITISYILAGVLGTPAYGQPGSEVVLALGAAFNAIVSLLIVLWAGGKSVKLAERFMMIVLIFFTTWITITVFKTTTLAQITSWRPDPAHAVPLGNGVDAMLAFSISWATVVGDFTRYAKNKSSATIAPMVGANLAIYWFALVGVIGVISVAVNTGAFDPNFADPSSIAVSLGLGWVALIVVLLATITTNMVSYYVLAYNVMNLTTKMSFKKATLMEGIFSIALAWLPIFAGSFLAVFTGFLGVLGAIFPPLLAIILVDYYIIRKGKYCIEHLDNKTGPYWYKNGINGVAIVSWIISVAIFLLLKGNGFGLNSVGSVFPGFLIAGLVYYILTKVALAPSDRENLSGIEKSAD